MLMAGHDDDDLVSLPGRCTNVADIPILKNASVTMSFSWTYY